MREYDWDVVEKEYEVVRWLRDHSSYKVISITHKVDCYVIFYSV